MGGGGGGKGRGSNSVGELEGNLSEFRLPIASCFDFEITKTIQPKVCVLR